MTGRKKRAKISSKKQRRLPTGITGLDSLIEGGFKDKSVVTVSGDPGSGKTTLAMQFLYTGAKKYGDTGVFISFDQTKEALMDDLSRYGWDLEDLIRKKKIHIVTLRPHEIENFQNYELMIHGIIEESGARRLAMDSVTSLILTHGSNQKARKEIIRLMEKLRGWGVTSVLTAESNTDSHGDMHSSFKVEFLSDAVVYLYNMRRANYRLHALEVVKARGTSIKSKMCPLKFGKHGIEVFPNQTVFK